MTSLEELCGDGALAETLTTRDAHGLYAKFNLELIAPGRIMQITSPYRAPH